MTNDYTIRRVENPGEAEELLTLFNGSFHPEKSHNHRQSRWLEETPLKGAISLNQKK